MASEFFANQGPDDWPITPALLFESASSAVILTDHRGTILLVNPQVVRLFGYERSELIGLPVERLLPERLRQRHLAHREAYYKDPSLRPMGVGLNIHGTRKDGSEFPIDVSLSPINTADARYILVSVRDITDRHRIELERNALAVELETERERHRIGMDLHDGIMQEVYAVGLALEIALDDFEGRPEATHDAIERAIDQLHGVIRNIRSYIFDLRPRQLTGNLSGALVDLVQEFRQNSQIEAEYAIDTDLAYVPSELATAVYLIVHEALSNVRKHANAQFVSLRVASDGEHTTLTIQDDGTGFDLTVDRSERHRGVRNMQARAAASGVNLRIESAFGQGTRVIAEIPRADDAGLRQVA